MDLPRRHAAGGARRRGRRRSGRRRARGGGTAEWHGAAEGSSSLAHARDGDAEHAAAAAWLLALCVKAREGAAADAEAEAALRSYLAPRAAADAGGAAAAALAAVDALESGGLDAARRGVSALGARLGEKCEVCAAAVPMVATATRSAAPGRAATRATAAGCALPICPSRTAAARSAAAARASCADDGGAGVLAAVPRGRCALCGVCVAATPRSLAFPDGPFC